MRRLAVIALALLLALGAGACGSGEEKNTAPETVQGAPPQESTQTQGEGEGQGESQGEGQGEGEGDAAAGKELFASEGCGGCHTFEEAGTSGTVGPNLDDASPDYEGAFQQITNGGGGMPPYGDRLSEKQIADLATFVSGSGG